MSEFGKCNYCQKTKHDTEGLWFDGYGFYCYNCMDQCAKCQEYFLPDTLKVYQGELFCDECIEKSISMRDREEG